MFPFHRLLQLLACAVLCFVAGCCSKCGRLFCDVCADIPRGAIPQPVGTHTCGWQATQTALAEQDDFVIYRYEWQGESAELGPFGRRHVANLTHRLQTQPDSLIVEPSENRALDDQRRAWLIAMLAAHEIPDAEGRVKFGYGTAEGIDGIDAQRLERGYLGSGEFGGGLGGGGFGGGGLGGGLGGGGSTDGP